jgi:hypothetical protein
MKASRMRSLAASAVLLLGLAQIVGDIAGSRLLKGLGAASAASPFPKVFCDVRCYEPFAADFTLLCDSGANSMTRIPITPELYSRLGGSYNRRNAYGAALSYAPRLPRPVWERVASFGLGPSGPLRRELALPQEAKNFTLHIATRTRGRGDTWQLQPGCAQ